jgi:hypothetical protein
VAENSFLWIHQLFNKSTSPPNFIIEYGLHLQSQMATINLPVHNQKGHFANRIFNSFKKR